MSKKLYRSHTVMRPGCGRRRGRLWTGKCYDRMRYGNHINRNTVPECPKDGDLIEDCLKEEKV